MTGHSLPNTEPIIFSIQSFIYGVGYVISSLQRT